MYSYNYIVGYVIGLLLYYNFTQRVQNMDFGWNALMIYCRNSCASRTFIFSFRFHDMRNHVHSANGIIPT